MGYSVKRSINIGEFFSALENSHSFLCNLEEFKQGIQGAKSFATKFHYSVLINSINGSSTLDGNEDNQIRFFFQEPNHGNIETHIKNYFEKQENFEVEVNILYLWDAIMNINTKQLLLMINTQHNYLFIMPWDSNSTIDNIKNNYKEAHLIMCLR
jgi:DNA polymerase III sliding clamp (beta) subunit (PCNA family)